MKVCIISNLYPPHARGGAEQVVVKTVEGLRNAGHEVVVITTAPKGEAKVTTQNGVRVYRFTPKNVFFYTDARRHSMFVRLLWHIIDTYNFSSTKIVQDILMHEKPDVVHTHNLMGVGFGIPKAVRSLGIYHVHTVHDVQLVEPSGIILKLEEDSYRYTGFPTLIYSFAMKQRMGSPDVVISPSQFLLDFYRSRKFFRKSRLVLLRNPVSLVSSTQHIKSDRCRFLYLGQVEAHKGTLLSVLAAQALPKGIDWELTIAGDGEALHGLKQEVGNNDRIHVLGRVARDQISHLFAHSDVTIVPSLCYENSPTVIFESFAHGRPVLASKVEGIEELIEEERNGKTFTTGDVKDLTGAMMWAATHKDQLQAMGKRARSNVDTLSQAVYMQTLEGYYRT